MLEAVSGEVIPKAMMKHQRLWGVASWGRLVCSPGQTCARKIMQCEGGAWVDYEADFGAWRAYLTKGHKNVLASFA